MSDATLIVTLARCFVVAAAAVAHAMSKHPTATATVIVLRVDGIVLLLSVDLIRMMRLAKPDRGVLRDRTSFDLVAGDEDVVAGKQRDRRPAEVDDAGEVVASPEGEHGGGRRQPLELRRFAPWAHPA